ncbi:MAG: haloacid dehalogenase-like hydrolase, partial [Clostridiales bacterium]|nr:haloacid dehalogenase-like hydrolase [Clostridiales bacterium]
MNVYDFDKTIFHKDTTAQFYLWSLRRWPKMLRFLPGTLIAALKMALGKGDKTAFKQALYRFLRDVPEPKKQIERFWD